MTIFGDMYEEKKKKKHSKLIWVKAEGWLFKGWQGCSRGNPKKQHCQPEENPVLPNYFTQIFFLIANGFPVISNAHHGSSKSLPSIYKDSQWIKKMCLELLHSAAIWRYVYHFIGNFQSAQLTDLYKYGGALTK